NSVIAGNRAAFASTTGANPGGGGGGGGVSMQGGTYTYTHVTVADNSVAGNLLGAGLLALGANGKGATVNLAFSIVANHVGGNGQPAFVLFSGSTANFQGPSLFANNTKNTNADGNPVASGTFNNAAAILNAASAGFVDAANRDYHLAQGSPAIDAAT